jgi:hypothetical protein
VIINYESGRLIRNCSTSQRDIEMIRSHADFQGTALSALRPCARTLLGGHDSHFAN